MRGKDGAARRLRHGAQGTRRVPCPQSGRGRAGTGQAGGGTADTSRKTTSHAQVSRLFSRIEDAVAATALAVMTVIPLLEIVFAARLASAFPAPVPSFSIRVVGRLPRCGHCRARGQAAVAGDGFAGPARMATTCHGGDCGGHWFRGRRHPDARRRGVRAVRAARAFVRCRYSNVGRGTRAARGLRADCPATRLARVRGGSGALLRHWGLLPGGPSARTPPCWRDGRHCLVSRSSCSAARSALRSLILGGAAAVPFHVGRRDTRRHPHRDVSPARRRPSPRFRCLR